MGALPCPPFPTTHSFFFPLPIPHFPFPTHFLISPPPLSPFSFVYIHTLSTPFFCYPSPPASYFPFASSVLSSHLAVCQDTVNISGSMSAAVAAAAAAATSRCNSANSSSSGNESSILSRQIAVSQPMQPPSRYESQKRRDWNTFGQYLRNHRPPLTLSRCSGANVLEFLRYLDQFGKTKVHTQMCPFFGHPHPPAPCPCPLRQAWGSLDALIGRLRAAFEENGGPPETNPFGARAVRLYLREVRDAQAKARGIAYEKKKRKRPQQQHQESSSNTDLNSNQVNGGLVMVDSSDHGRPSMIPLSVLN